MCSQLFIGGVVGLAAVCAVPAGWTGAQETHSVTRYGAAGDGRTLDTRAIQAAIDAAAERGGGVVVLPPGCYLSGTLRLRSRVTLRLEPGATLLGSTDIRHYPKTIPSIRSYTDTYVYQSLIYAENAEDVAIEGRGVIDGQGAAFPRRHPTRKYGERPYLIRMIRCRGVRIRDVTLRDSPMWVQHYLACRDVLVDGVAVQSQVNANNDGLDIDGCEDVRIANCSIVSGDDAIVLKSTLERPCRNVTISNCVLSTRCNGLKMGTESNGGFENIAISNCVLDDVRLAGLALEIVDGGTMDRVAVSNLAMRRVGAAVFIRLGDRARPYRPDAPRPGVGRLRNVTISGVTADVADRVGCAIAGLPGHPVENVSLSNMQLSFPGGGAREWAAREVPEQRADYPEYKMFGPLPAYGLYGRHVRGLVLRDVDLRRREPEPRPALVFDDVADLTAAGCRAECQRDGQPMFVLRNVRGALLTGCSPLGQASGLVRLEGGCQAIRLIGNPWPPESR